MSQSPPPAPMEMPPPLQPYSQPAEGGKGLAIASMVLGLVSLLLSVLPAMVAIILGIVSLAKKKPGKGMAITGIVAGAIGIVLLPALLAVSLPAVNRSLEMTRRSSCMNNLKGMGTALALYQQEYNNEYPPSLDLLIKNGESPKLFRCPSCDRHREFDYFYLAPAKNAPGETMVACDFRDNHKGEIRNVLYMDGHVAILKEPAFQQALAQPENAAFAEALRKVESGE